jgi:hypothetical protein
MSSLNGNAPADGNVTVPTAPEGFKVMDRNGERDANATDRAPFCKDHSSAYAISARS